MSVTNKPADNDLRNKVYERVCSAIGQEPDVGISPRQIEAARQRLQGPVWGLRLTAVFNLFLSLTGFCVLGFLLWYGFLSEPDAELSVRRYHSYLDTLIGLSIMSPLAVLFGIFQWFASSRVRKLKDFWTGMAGFITAVIPVHPGWIVGLPTGCWGLAAMGNESVFRVFEADSQDLTGKPLKNAG